MSLRNIRIVLHRPRGAINVGAVARVIGNTGLGDLVVVRAKPLRSTWVRKMAAHAGGVVDHMRQCVTLADAIADCALVIGTTCRAGGYREVTHAPHALAPAIVARAQTQPVALVFGPEDHGLSNADVKLCHQLITIPSAADYPSLNLAQAVMVCGYELFVAAQETLTEPMLPAIATTAAMEDMYERLQAALLAIGFLHPENPEHIMFSLRRLFGRVGIDEREMRILLGLARQIEWYGYDGWRVMHDKAAGRDRPA
ncbi:MAG: RNA methyltransferase [Deltaproteobacteria bacterium]|nr:RNA methyltransferase [Deltaproteobacteria bacterium]MBI3389486.1 RNA methyltransferase [Deltaproteobacteria bacterium]